MDRRFVGAALLLVMALPGVAAAGPDGAAWIRMRAAIFDPLRHGEPTFDGSLPRGPLLRPSLRMDRYQLLQFHDRIVASTHRDLIERGVEILGYVPDRTLLVRLPDGWSALALTSIPGLRFAGRFLPGYKLSPNLSALLQDNEVPEGTLGIDVYLFPGEAPDSLAAALRKQSSRIGVKLIRRGARSRIAINLPPESASSTIGSLLRDPAVEFVARRYPLETHNDNAVWIGQSYDRIFGPGEAQEPDPKPYSESATLWNHGLTGSGQIVAVADTGLEYGMCFFHDPAHAVVPQSVPPPGNLLLQHNHRKVLAYNATHVAALDHDDAFRHGTHVSATVAGDDSWHAAQGGQAGHDHGDGMAPEAKLVFEDVSGQVNSLCNTQIVVPSVEELLAQEYDAGARISSNSWGSSDLSGLAALEVDSSGWAHEDFLVFFSAGNNGGVGIDGLGACKNCIAVGATENWDSEFLDVFGSLDPENMTKFSTRGPTADGRVKPDIVAPGQMVYSARFPVDYIPDEGDPACDLGDPNVCLPSFGGCYITDPSAVCSVDRLLGTSMSTPIAAGLAALARQYFTDGFYPSGQASPADTVNPSAALLKAVLLNGARNMTGRRYERRGVPADHGPLEDAPSNNQGWGRIALDDALYFAGDARRLHVFDLFNADGLNTGEAIRIGLSVTAVDEPLKLSLVWTDAPGEPIAAGALINDLDLELVAPDGTTYRGNQWTADDVNVPGDKESLPGAPGRDAVNNVEGIWVSVPQAGLHQVIVHGTDVRGHGGVFTQGCALVVTGVVEPCSAHAAPQNLSATPVGTTRIDLAWDPVPGALGYALYRNSSVCSGPMAADQVVALPSDPTSHADTTVLPGVAYNYTIRAVVSAEGCETLDSPCITAMPLELDPPPPVPDGIVGSPMRASPGSVPGSIDLQWDTGSCPASGYHVLYGSLGQVETLTVDGALCAIGASGDQTWTNAPAGDIWFVIVADDAGATEGSWGRDSAGAQRAGANLSGQCGLLARDNSGSCP